MFNGHKACWTLRFADAEKGLRLKVGLQRQRSELQTRKLEKEHRSFTKAYYSAYGLLEGVGDAGNGVYRKNSVSCLRETRAERTPPCPAEGKASGSARTSWSQAFYCREITGANYVMQLAKVST